MSHPLPKFGFDTFDDLGNWALIVSGRFLDEPPYAPALVGLVQAYTDGRWALRA
jgi:hypothetical protein